uniref:Secreted protein n=1 Tax=Thraustotheca clavata TaxID=74557 RepID=A0A0A7CMF1_9STRA|nr:secreted protein [Thraustotheca clavata]
MHLQLLVVAVVATLTSAVEFRFTNKCPYTINLRGPGGKFICDIPPRQTRGALSSSTQHPIKQTVMLEFSVKYGKVWYDMSNIPPGVSFLIFIISLTLLQPDHCTSYEDCKRHTGGKSGFNVPVDVIPTRHNNGRNCRKIHDTRPDAPDAFLFPGNTLKNADCPFDEVLDVVYCPGGRLRG